MLGHPSLRDFRTLVAGVLLGLLLPGSTALAGAKGADDSGQSPTEFSELGLEDLLAVEVVPISVLGTHTHLEGEWMIGYRFMTMAMKFQNVRRVPARNHGEPQFPKRAPPPRMLVLSRHSGKSSGSIGSAAVGDVAVRMKAPPILRAYRVSMVSPR